MKNVGIVLVGNIKLRYDVDAVYKFEKIGRYGGGVLAKAGRGK